MKQRTLRRRLKICLFLASLCNSVFAFAQHPAPEFNVQTLDGRALSGDSLRGSPVLLQFWTTWCPVCRGDQQAVDNIAAEYGSKGLTVLAIDVGEPEATVRHYLQASPRAVTVATDPVHSAFAKFGGTGYPHYVVLDSQGNIVASRSGGEGEGGLRYLLTHAGLAGATSPLQAAGRASSQGTGPNVPRWINAPASQRTVTAKPLPNTVFILLTGEQLESNDYVINAGYLSVKVGDQYRRVALSALDATKTVAVNKARGIDLKLPTNSREVFLGF